MKRVIWQKKISFLLAAVLVMTLCSCHSSTVTENTTEEGKTAETLLSSGADTDTEAESETEAETEVEYPYDFTDPDFFKIDGWELCLPWAAINGVTAEGKYFQLKTVDGYAVMQGACSDGTYMYALLENKGIFVDGEKRSYCMLFKIDLATWEIVAQSEGLPVDHGNGLTYNSNTNQLVVAHCQRLTKGVSFIDPETLTVIDTIEIDRAITSITYNDIRDQYVIMVKGTRDFAILDADFNEVAYYTGVETGLSNQNISCDDDYIYLLHTGTNSNFSGVEVFLCFDWEGNYCGAYRLKNYSEVEALIHVNGTVYASFYTSGGRFYRLNFDESLRKSTSTN